MVIHPTKKPVSRLAWLAAHPLFGMLPARVLKRLDRAVDEQRHPKGSVIYAETGNPSHLWAVKTGRVRLLRYSSSGRALALGLITPGGLFCFPAAVNQCHYPCRAVADSNTDVLRFPASMVRQLLSRHASFACEALRLTCRDICRSHTLCSASQEPVGQRLLAVLVHLLDTFGATIPLSQQQIAELAGIARETASRTLLKLEGSGTLTLGFGKVTVKSPARLRALLEE